MTWTVELHPLFDDEFENLSDTVQDSLFVEIELLERYAFDPERKAILLIAGDKSGRSEKRFYKT